MVALVVVLGAAAAACSLMAFSPKILGELLGNLFVYWSSNEPALLICELVD